MISRYDVILNGVSLSSISPEILILDIQYPQVQVRNESYVLARRQGAHITNRYIGSNPVNVLFEVQAYDISERQTIVSEIIKWARNGGILQTNDRSGQRLKCICDQFPSVTSAKDRRQTLQIVFTAYALPFWEDVYPAKLTLTGTNANGTLYIPGNVDNAFVEVAVTANGALTDITLNAGDTTLILSGINVASGGQVLIQYDDDMIQSIKTGSVSLLDKRSGNDDLLVDSGKTSEFSFTANVDCTVEYSVRGLWL